MKKKQCFILILAAILAFGLFGCGAKPEENGSGKEEKAPAKPVEEGTPMDFKSIKITETGSMAYSTAYSAKRTENGVHLEYYIYQTEWDYETESDVEQKQMICEYDGDEEVYRKVALLVGTYQLDTWDGFSGSDPDVTDGSSFSLEAKLESGKKVSASGTNHFPDGYRAFVNQLDEICSTQLVTDTEFDAGDYTLKLPESWVGNVYATFRDGMVGFGVKTKKQNRMILCFYEAPYDYGGEGLQYTTVLSFIKDTGSTWYIKMRKMDEADSARDEMNKKQRAICRSLDEDMTKIAESVYLKEDYEHTAEPETYEPEEPHYIDASDYPTEYNPENSAEGDGTGEGDGENTDDGSGEGGGEDSAGQGDEGGGDDGGGDDGGGSDETDG